MTRYRMMSTLCLAAGTLHTAHARPQTVQGGVPAAPNAGAVEPIDYYSSSQRPVVESSSAVTTPSLAPSASESVPSISPIFSPSSASLLPIVDSTSTGTLFLTTTVVSSISRPTSSSGYYSDYHLSSYSDYQHSSYSPVLPPSPPVTTSNYVPVPVPSSAVTTGATNVTYVAPPPPAHTTGVPVDNDSGCRQHGYHPPGHGHGHYSNGSWTGSPGTGGGAGSGSGAGGSAPGSGAGGSAPGSGAGGATPGSGAGGAGPGDHGDWDGEDGKKSSTGGPGNGDQGGLGGEHDAAPDHGVGKGEEGSEPVAEAGAGTVGMGILGVVVSGLLSVAFLV